MSHAHFQEKWKDEPARAPSIAIAFEQADLSALCDWVKPGQKVFCAWSPKAPETVEWARSTVSKLSKLGIRACIYPKDPAAAPAPGAEALGAKAPVPK